MNNRYHIFLLLIFSFIISTFSFAQGEGNYWYFGENAGLNFATDPPTVLNDGSMYTWEGCASISNQNGDLLFYTDGRDVWNRFHGQMPNGHSLLGNSSATQSAVTVPHPGNPNLYYVFTVDALTNNLANGFNYSILDLTLDDGKGDIDVSNKNILLIDKVPEKVTAIKHGNEPAYWVITHGYDGDDANRFYVYKIDINGLNSTPQTYNIGSNHSGDMNHSRGYLKASPDGTLLACGIGGDENVSFELFDFNDLTGDVTNYRTAGTSSNDPYGIEFSPDGTKMYISSLGGGGNPGKLIQVDFANMDAETTISINDPDYSLYGALQISPHGVIYIASGGSGGGNSAKRYLHGITEPNEVGIACNYQKNLIDLNPNKVRYGLPTFIQSFFLAPSFTAVNTCFGDLTDFTLEIELDPSQILDSVIWNFGDPASGADSVFYATVDPFGASHIFTNKGAYTVNVRIVLVGGFSFSSNQSVTIDPTPVFDISDFGGIVTDTFRICYGEQIKFKVTPWSFATASWSNGSTGEASGWYNSSGDIITTVTNAQGCVSTDSTYLEVQPEIIFNFNIPNFCEGDAAVIITDSVDLTGGVFLGAAVTFVDPDYILDPALIGLGGASQVNYTYTDAYGCSGSDQTFSFHYELPVVGLNLPQDNICIDAIPITISGGESPLGGTFTGTGVSGETFDPQIAGIGTHTIEYTYEDAHTCSNNTTAEMIVNDLPTVSFGAIPAICQNMGAVVIDQGDPPNGQNGGIGTYSGTQIDAGGNFDSNTAPGTYDLVYEFIDANSCSDTAQRSVDVIQEPQEAISTSVSVDAYCIVDQPTDITLECVGPDNSYVWYANDVNGTPLGYTKIISIPAPSVTTQYLVRSETSCGNSASISVTVTVYDSPTASFTVDDICEDKVAAFNNTSSVTEGSITSWFWDFGDGTTSTLENPAHTFTGYGSQNISLNVTTDNNCQNLSTSSMEVFDKPSASFGFSSACLGNETEFTNTSTAPQSDITVFDWEMEGIHYTTEDALHTFSGSGNYNVILSIETEHSCTENTSMQVAVNPLPVSTFTYFNPCRSNVVELTNNSTPSGLGGSPIASYLWNFNNGETSDEEELIYIYPDAGIYSIDLTVTDENGCSHFYTKNNVIVSPDFDVSITSDPFCIDVEGVFDGEPIPDFLPMDDYEWLLPDGSTVHGEDIPYTFDAAGTYEIALVGTLGTCTAGKTYTVEVKELPTTGFSSVGQCLGLPISFTDTSSADGLALISWNWDFADGHTSTMQNPQNTYSNSGIYSTRLTVTDANGCENLTANNLTFRPLPSADFSPILPLCEAVNISFNNTSSTPGTFTDYLWNMDDGNSYTSENVVHTYSSGGNKNISLIVTDDWTCKDTIEQTVFITPDFTLG
ncbi:MAG: PKD domain-containing protein, partial [Bacteroidales bacterium]|nr:PKD domain-containing protein [Bacteroidales bacterium]